MAPAMRIRYGWVNGRTRRSAGKSRDGAGASEGRESRGGIIRRFYPKFPRPKTLEHVQPRETRRWRKRDSNFWSHLQRGQPNAELASSFFRARLHRLRSFFISENDDFELPASQGNLARRAT